MPARLSHGECVQATPDQERPAAKIDDAAGEAFVHGDVCFAGKRVAGVETSAVPPDTLLGTQGLEECLAQDNAAILDRVMGIHRQVAGAPRSRSRTACLAKRFSMWSKKGIPVWTLDLPWPSRSRRTRI